MSKLSTFGRLIYGAFLSSIPQEAAKAIDTAAKAVTAPSTEKSKLAKTQVVASSALQALSAIAGSDLGQNPKFLAIWQKVNDVLHEAAKETAELAEASKPQP